jgi:signal transduction histidine kinase
MTPRPDSQPSSGPIGPSLVLMLVLLGSVLAMLPAMADERVSVRNLRELRQAVASRQRQLCDLNVEAVICAADPALGLLTLKDPTGVEVISLDLGGQKYHPGDRLRIMAPQCALIRRKWSVALATAPVVDNGGIHSTSEAEGRITLNPGLHPLRLYYFNVDNPAVLEVRYAGPGLPAQTIPPQALYLDRASTNGSRENGLEYFCYDDNPATLDALRNQTPIHTGIARNFDLSLRQPEQDVAMVFRGLIDIQQPGEYVFTVRSDDGGELYIGELKPEIRRLGVENPPVAAPTSARSQSMGLDPGEWCTVEGTVTYAGWGADGLEIQLRENSRTVRLWLANQPGVPPTLLLNARLRATGAFRNLNELDGEKDSGRMSIIGPDNLQLLDVAPDQWKRIQITSFSNAIQQASADGVISHLQGIVSGPLTGRNFQFNDGTGDLVVQIPNTNGLANGLDVELLGTVRQTLQGPVMDMAFWRPAERQPGLPRLTTAAQVQQLSARDAARQLPVTVRGVITCLVEWGGAVVQDSTRGVFFSFEPTYRDGLEPGDYAEIQGVTAVGDFAPIIDARSILVLGPGEMPEPVNPTWNQLMRGSLDSQYAEVRGIVTEAAGNRITLLTENGKIKVLLHNTGEASLGRLLNTLVRIRGCLLAEWDSQTRQVRVGEIRFRNPSIEIDQLPMADPFSAPAKTISDLLLFDLNASGFERVKITGQIVHVRGTELFLMQDRQGLRFRLAADRTFQPGDLAEVVGIPELSGPSPRLHEAVARKIGAAPLTTATPWAIADLEVNNSDAIRIETEARLIGLHRTGTEWVLELQVGLRTFRARVDSGESLASQFPLGSILRVTGVYATLDGERNGDLSGFEVLLNSSNDILLLRRPPWWTLRRLIYIVASLLAVLAAAAIWISQLHRQVVQRTQMLEREHARRELAEKERALEVERSRIARDLHDDLGSSLMEIRVLASSGLRQPANDARTPTLFQAITEKARTMVSALDVIIWAVDSEENTLQSLADYLSGYAAEYLSASEITCRFKIPVALPDQLVDGQIRHDLFLAVKEALHNVVRHSQATEVEFLLEREADGIRIVIQDNGQGFDPAEIDAEGHGLRNLPGRLAHMGGRCEVNSSPGGGTRVTIFVPAPK